MEKYYVLFPVRMWDSSKELEEFETKEDALNSINADLKNEWDFEVSVEDYRIFKGVELNLKEKTTVTEVVLEE